MKRLYIMLLLLIFPTVVLADSKNEAEQLWNLEDKAYKEKRYEQAISFS